MDLKSKMNGNGKVEKHLTPVPNGKVIKKIFYFSIKSKLALSICTNFIKVI